VRTKARVALLLLHDSRMEGERELVCCVSYHAADSLPRSAASRIRFYVKPPAGVSYSLTHSAATERPLH
jgi:hypothetical protein